MGLHTLEVKRGFKPGIYNGVIRNLAFILLTISIGRGGIWMSLLSLVALLAIGIETYFIFTLRSGIRIGDILAYTRVFDYKDEHTKFIEQFLRKEETH